MKLKKYLFICIFILLWANFSVFSLSFGKIKTIRLDSPANEPPNYPVGIAFRDDGTLFVSEWKNGRIFRFTEDGRFIGHFAENLEGPTGIAFDSVGNLFVVCNNSNKIEILDRSAISSSTIEGGGNPFKPFASPRGIAINKEDEIFVCDSDNFRVVHFNSKYEFKNELLFKFGKYEALQKPRGVNILKSGNIAVTYSEVNRFVIFSPEGTVLLEAGSGGEGKEQFSSARYLSSDLDGNIYISDYNNNRIQIYSESGNYIGVVTAPIYRKSSGIVRPEGIACNKLGMIYCCSSTENSILVFSPPQFNINYNLARVEYNNGNIEKAGELFEKAFLLNREHTHCRNMVKKILITVAEEKLADKDYDSSMELFQKLKGYFPEKSGEFDFYLKKLEIHQFRFVYYSIALGIFLFFVIMMFRSAVVSIRDSAED